MATNDGARIILSAWRSISLSTYYVLARLSTVRCYECLRPIRWWNRRVWLDDERCSHLQCSEGRLFLRALVAGQIQRSQLISNEVPPDPRGGSHLSNSGSSDNELPNLDTATAQDEAVERLEPQQQHAEEVPKTHFGTREYKDSTSSVRALGQNFWHVLGSLVPHRPPRLPRLCMLCGGVEVSEMAVVCSKCGTSLRPWS